MKMIISLLLLALVVENVDPPILSDSFTVAFDETVKKNQTAYHVNGFFFYDYTNKRQRVDRANGEYDIFCGTVLPNVTTPCLHLTVQGKRYLIFPKQSKCCLCCDSQHGCGVLKDNWLQGAQYLGNQTLIDTQYEKWNQQGVFGYNYFYVTLDNNRTPRRLDQNGQVITDYIISTYVNKTLPDSIFALPSFCSPQQNCPLTSICGKFRSSSNRNLKKQ